MNTSPVCMPISLAFCLGYTLLTKMDLLMCRPDYGFYKHKLITGKQIKWLLNQFYELKDIFIISDYMDKPTHQQCAVKGTSLIPFMSSFSFFSISYLIFNCLKIEKIFKKNLGMLDNHLFRNAQKV